MSGIAIYSLSDPRNNAVRYIGQSNDPSRRIKQHLLHTHNNSGLIAWIWELNRQGLTPKMEVLKVVHCLDADKAEAAAIRFFRGQNAPLLNLSDPLRANTKGNNMARAEWEVQIARIREARNNLIKDTQIYKLVPKKCRAVVELEKAQQALLKCMQSLEEECERHFGERYTNAFTKALPPQGGLVG